MLRATWGLQEDSIIIFLSITGNQKQSEPVWFTTAKHSTIHLLCFGVSLTSNVFADMAASRVSNCCRGTTRRVACVRVRAVARRPRARWRARSRLWTSRAPARPTRPSTSSTRGPWPPSTTNRRRYPARPPHKRANAPDPPAVTPLPTVNSRGFKIHTGKTRFLPGSRKIFKKILGAFIRGANVKLPQYAPVCKERFFFLDPSRLAP